MTRPAQIPRADGLGGGGADVEPPGLVPDIADDIADMLRRGRLSGQSPIKRIWWVTTDGRKASFDLPEPAVMAGGGDEGLRQRILDALSESRAALSRKQLAKALGLKSASGRFGVECSALLDYGRIHERDGLLTNDVSKFPDSD